MIPKRSNIIRNVRILKCLFGKFKHQQEELFDAANDRNERTISLHTYQCICMGILKSLFFEWLQYQFASRKEGCRKIFIYGHTFITEEKQMWLAAAHTFCYKIGIQVFRDPYIQTLPWHNYYPKQIKSLLLSSWCHRWSSSTWKVRFQATSEWGNYIIWDKNTVVGHKG